ncbi:MAG: phosphoglycerate mutase (2,3-diphosphoglycerate-independent) [Armatimonadetes bacterium]|nr:phosphoglycerate mutase (2,3-diphosphoglycerate-independent) [Armatimonadota bacterium]
MPMADELTYPLAKAVLAAYAAGEEDEALNPLVLADGDGRPVGRVKAGAYVIFYNIRGEREVELSQALTDPGFDEFQPHGGFGVNLATMIQYSPRLPARVAFPPLEELRDTLCEVACRSGRRVVKVVESEKAIHVNYFLNGKRTEPFPGEERVIVESHRDVALFDERPEMSVAHVADATLEKLRDPACDLVITNFANIDVLGHIENPEAIQRGVEAVDAQLGRVLAAAREAGVTAVVTADHGTAEKWFYPEGSIDTGHTDSPVALAIVGAEGITAEAAPAVGGALTDVAPTVLALLGLEAPEAMTGRALVPRGPGGRVLLLIVDGWGVQPPGPGNLISQAETPNIDALLQGNPNTLLAASGEAVGLPQGTVGNSEAGHLHLGSGRRVPADRLRIAEAIADGSFLQNEAFVWAAEGAKRDGAALHLLGIVSFFSSHGSLEYAVNLLELCGRRGVPEVYVHGLLGRRGERPEAGARYIGDMEAECERRGVGRVVSVIGRHWALDREEHWDRVQKAYDMLVLGKGTLVRGE